MAVGRVALYSFLEIYCPKTGPNANEIDMLKIESTLKLVCKIDSLKWPAEINNILFLIYSNHIFYQR